MKKSADEVFSEANRCVATTKKGVGKFRRQHTCDGLHGDKHKMPEIRYIPGCGAQAAMAPMEQPDDDFEEEEEGEEQQ